MTIAAYIIALQLKAKQGIFEIAVRYAFSGFAAMAPVMIAALFWKRSTKWGALAATLFTAGCLVYFALLQNTHKAGDVIWQLGQGKEAIAQFDDVIKRAGGDSLYGQMAQLGKADAQAQAGEIDSAIATWKELAARKDAKLPEDAILMQLGRAYQAKGNTAEARKTFTDIVDNHPDSPYVADARKELESLKG